MSNRSVFGIEGLTDDDGTMERLHYDGNYDNQWTAETKREYQSIEKRISKIGAKRAAYEIYAWCDTSGFDYWVRRQQEPNYIQISVSLKRKLTKLEVARLKRDLEDAASDAECIFSDCETAVHALYNKETENE